MPPTARGTVPPARRGPYETIDLQCRLLPSCAAVTSSYRMAGRCTNCQAGPLIGQFTAGHQGRGGACPECGCHNVHWDKIAVTDPGATP
jgi:hypothetical protein